MVGRGLLGHVELPNVAAICEREDGSIVLVDAGWSAQTCEDPIRTLGRLRTWSLGLRIRPGDDLASQMRRAGLDPARVTSIIATHLHFDHVGGSVDFPNAEVIATREESAVAREAGNRRGYRQQDLAAGGRLKLVDLDPHSVLGFPRSHRLDDEITLADTAGHTPGHVAVLIKSAEGLWLHAGDAADQMSEIRNRTVTPLARMLAQDLDRLRTTHDRLRDAWKDPAVRLVLSHDGDLFDALPRLG